jgi:hypothetical protein
VGTCSELHTRNATAESAGVRTEKGFEGVDESYCNSAKCQRIPKLGT